MTKSGNTRNDEIVNQLDDDIFIALFRKGAYGYLEDGLSDDQCDPDDTLSASSEKRIMQLVKKEIRREQSGKSIRTLTKVAAIFLIVLAVCAVTIVSVEAFRVPVFNLFVNTNDESTDIIVSDEPNIEDQDYLTKSIYVPAGYELTDTKELVDATKYIYSNAEGQSIFVSRLNLGSFFGFDTEDAETGQVDINGSQALYSINKGFVSLSFKTDEYAYLIQAPVELSEVVKIAESIY